jgi:predicted nucleic acid-binding protein
MKRSHPLVVKRLQSVPVGDVCMSVITKAELLYGVEVSPRRAQDAAALAAFLPYVEALDLTDDATMHTADIRADFKKTPIVVLFYPSTGLWAHAGKRANAAIIAEPGSSVRLEDSVPRPEDAGGAVPDHRVSSRTTWTLTRSSVYQEASTPITGTDVN